MSSTLLKLSSQSSGAMAHSSKVKACEDIVMNFDAKGATVEAMQVYADCVDLLHPRYSGDSLFFLCAGVLVASVTFTLWFAYRS